MDVEIEQGRVGGTRGAMERGCPLEDLGHERHGAVVSALVDGLGTPAP